MKLLRKTYSYGHDLKVPYEEDRIREELQRIKRENKGESNIIRNNIDRFGKNLKKRGVKRYEASTIPSESDEDAKNKYINIKNSNWRGKSKMVEDDEQTARDNIKDLATMESEEYVKDFKNSSKVLGTVTGAILGGLASTKTKSAVPLLIGTGVGLGTGYLVSKNKGLQDKRRKVGYQHGEIQAVLHGHGDRERGSKATSNVLKVASNEDQLKEDLGYDNYAYVTERNKDGSIKERRLARYDSRTFRTKILRDKGEK